MTHPVGGGARPGTLKALGALGTAVIVSVGYIGVTYAIGLRELWAGFVLLLCFGFFAEMKLQTLPSVVAGALFGIVMAAIPVWLSPSLGTLGAYAVMLTMILIAIYLFLLGRAAVLVNPTTLTFLTIVTNPHILPAARVGDIVLGTIAGAAYFGGLAGIGALLARRKDAAAAPPGGMA
ncbi:hypothetical protein [uncultured Sphingomonas sp.]|uniref:hypothetical protein n=1 Tax=uncultured Sphingomonas sp. TaxID=158754 RepID=UPI0026148007|nr:hypothetical protein [uncultured Sphingomonas sp.]